MQHALTHALVLGTSLLIASGIVIIRLSMARPSAAGNRGPAPAAAVKGGAKATEPEAPDPAQTLKDAASLLRQAQELYQIAASAEGREGELAQAKKLLEQVRGLLQELPEDNPKARDLRRAHQQLVSDVTRVSGF